MYLLRKGFYMKRTLAFAAIIAAGLSLWIAGTAIAQREQRRERNRVPNQNRLSEKDKEFMLEAASGGMLEVKLGKIAEDQVASPAVKKFGALMVRDHTDLNKQLMDLAERKGVNIPKKMNEKDQAEFEKLSKLNGADFDATYIKRMVADHVHDVSAFETEANDGQDPDVRAFANKALPTLRDHLERARELATRIR